MKKLIFLLIFILIFTSCKKEDEDEYKNVFGEIIYTDSFSPQQWENPIARTKIEAVDKDIGKFIKPDVMHPELRKMMLIVKQFIYLIDNDNIEEIKNITTSSAFNSFNLRYKKNKLPGVFTIRVAYPDSFYIETAKPPKMSKNNQVINEINTDEPIWIDFKILFKTASIISKIELTKIDNNYKITDFDESLLDSLSDLQDD